QDPLALLRNLRDHLRPDEWLRVAAVGWAAAWLLWGLLRWRGQSGTWGVAIPLSVAMVSLIAIHTQRTSTWAPGQAVVVVDDTPGFRLPGKEEGKPKFILAEAEYVTIAEERTDWVRIRA